MELSEKERKEILDERWAWKDVFNSPSGRIVFRRMARECYFYNDDISPEDWDAIGKSNYFRAILERLGVANAPSLTCDAIADAVLDALMKLPLSVKENDLTDE